MLADAHPPVPYAKGMANNSPCSSMYSPIGAKSLPRPASFSSVYLETREDIDTERLAYYGMSWGGYLGAVIPAVEDRVDTVILVAGGVRDIGQPEVNSLNYVHRISVPLLTLNGRLDTILSYEHATRPMYEMVATPEEHRVLKGYDTDHIPPKAEYVKEILDWLDKYFGPVEAAAP